MLQVSIAGMTDVTFPQLRQVTERLSKFCFDTDLELPAVLSGPQSPRSATLRGHLDRISFMSHTLSRFCLNREENEGKESKSGARSELGPVFMSSEWNSSSYLTPPARET